MKSPLRYPGGKTRAIKHLLPHIPEGDVCSPFLGGGSLELVLSKDRKVYAYDAFYPLYNFWNCLLTDKKYLLKQVRRIHPLDKKLFGTLRMFLRDYEEGMGKSVEMAAAYFAINRSSFSGATLSGGFSQQAADGRFNESSIKRLANFEAPNLKVGFSSFEDSLQRHEKEFLYLDPPYFLEAKSRLYGKNGDMHLGFDHKMLYSLLTNRENWLCCYNDCEFVRENYADYEIIPAAWAYGMNKSKESNEVFIISRS